MIVNGGCARELSEAERAAYDAPFPDESYKEGARQFPALVPITPEHASVAENLAAWQVLETFDKPFVTAFADSDPVTKGGAAVSRPASPAPRPGPRHLARRPLHPGRRAAGNRRPARHPRPPPPLSRRIIPWT